MKQEEMQAILAHFTIVSRVSNDDAIGTGALFNHFPALYNGSYNTIQGVYNMSASFVETVLYVKHSALLILISNSVNKTTSSLWGKRKIKISVALGSLPDPHPLPVLLALPFRLSVFNTECA